VNVSLEATQTIVIKQDSGTGNNSAVNGANPTTGTCNTSQTLSQYQNQTSIVTATGDITQNMNPTPNGPTDGNASIDIEQNQLPRGVGTGTNSAVFDQKTNQQAVANTKAGKTVTQLQNSTQGDGTTASPFSGIVGTINQDSTGQSTATVTQDEIQCEDAANTSASAALTGCSTTSDAVTGITLNQTQNGPVGLFTPPAKSTGRVPYYHKGTGTSQLTGAVAPHVDTFNLTQTSSQYADQTNGNTTVLQSNIMQGDCKSSGNGSDTGGSCAASQQATLNGVTSGGTTSDGYTAGSIDKLTIKCTNGHDTCQATPPPKPTIDEGSKPPNPSESRDATFTWTDDATAGVTFECKLDDGSFDACSSGGTGATFSDLALGSHTFEVRAVDTTPDQNASAAASYSWAVVPYVTFDVSDPDFGASAGWQGDPGSPPIDLTVGSDEGTYAQVTFHNFEGIKISDLDEPTFTTDTYIGGSPRYLIDFSDGNYVFGFPSQAGHGSASWELVLCTPDCGSSGFMTWGDIQTAEGSATVIDAAIEVDFGLSPPDTYSITGFNFDTYDLSFFGNHWYG
jgi:hypothetical protein